MKSHHYLIAAGLAFAVYAYANRKGRATADSASTNAKPIEAGWWTFAGNWSGANA